MTNLDKIDTYQQVNVTHGLDRLSTETILGQWHRAETKLARVEALADEFGRMGYGTIAARLRAALERAE